MAAAFGPELTVAHEDERSLLMLDRDPIRWAGREGQGLGWIEGDVWRGAGGDPANWGEVATLGACGLALDGRRRFLHSSVSGHAPVYWMSDGGAAYFASRIDALVQAAPDSLTVDWDAWAAILVLRYPLGERTPFAEIRRLEPFATLGRRFGRWRQQRPTWPWTEIEADRTVEQGADLIAEALLADLPPLPEETVCPLSGGLDSRLLASVIVAGSEAKLTGVTVSDDEGANFEEDQASRAAKALGIGHETAAGRVEDYPADWGERALGVEHQFVDHAWLVPLAHRVSGLAPVADGFAIDTFLQSGARFHIDAVVDASRPRYATQALFERLGHYGQAHKTLQPEFHAPIVDRVQSQFFAAARPFEGHPCQANLQTYATRTARGVSTYPTGLLGCEACIFVPGAHDPVVRAMLSVSTAAKHVERIHPAIQRRIDRRLDGVPSTGNTEREPPSRPRRWRSDPALAMHRDLIGNGPLTPYVEPGLVDWLNDPGRGELPPDFRLGMEAISLFHHWWRRYRDRLKDADPSELRR